LLAVGNSAGGIEVYEVSDELAIADKEASTKFAERMDKEINKFF
jgi:hypothetical protein